MVQPTTAAEHIKAAAQRQRDTQEAARQAGRDIAAERAAQRDQGGGGDDGSTAAP